MRATIHLVSADDALALRPLIQPVLERGFRGSPFGRAVAGRDMTDVMAAGRELVEAAPRTNPEIARILGERFPDVPTDSLAYVVSYLVPLVHVPPRGLWGRTGPVARTSVEAWLGRPLASSPSIDELVLRYLAAFGPATVQDMRAWSGLTGLGGTVDRLRPRLETFRDERGKELFDLPDAPRPDPETPAPPRFLPEYDNVLIGHADRSRIIPAGRAIPLPPGNGAAMGTVLFDGMFAGTWRVTREPTGATLTIQPFEPIAGPSVWVSRRRGIDCSPSAVTQGAGSSFVWNEQPFNTAFMDSVENVAARIRMRRTPEGSGSRTSPSGQPENAVLRRTGGGEIVHEATGSALPSVPERV